MCKKIMCMLYGRDLPLVIKKTKIYKCMNATTKLTVDKKIMGV